jgi:hypothetical protein
VFRQVPTEDQQPQKRQVAYERRAGSKEMHNILEGNWCS